MIFSDIVSLVTAKVGLAGDSYAAARALEYVQNRHRYIYDSFDWTAAQDTLSVTVEVGTGIGHIGDTSTDVEVANAEKIISARFGGNFLDPVTPSFIFEAHPETLTATGMPLYYWQKFNQSTRNLNVRMFPAADASGTLDLLVKVKFDDSATEPLIPNIDDALITFVLADMWEYMRQIGKAQAKLQEAMALLQAAQAKDTPSAPRPRSSKSLTATGTTVGELTDSVCDIIGRWEPDIRESVKERIRRNYQVLWDMYMLPESLIIANVPLQPDQQQVVLPHLFDRVVEVRTNVSGPLTQAVRLMPSEIQYYFGISQGIFEQSGSPVFFSMLPSVATQVLSPFNEPVDILPDVADTGITVFLKGESQGIEFSESKKVLIEDVVSHVDDNPSDTISKNSYDTLLTITKPVTQFAVNFWGATSRTFLLSLNPTERERKHLRIWLLPNLNPQTGTNFAHTANISLPGSILVLGKRQMSPLFDDNDSPQLRNVSNILINAAAGDILNRLGNAEQGNALLQKAQTLTQVMVKAETEQNAFQPHVLPYTESGYCSISGVTSSDLTALTFP